MDHVKFVEDTQGYGLISRFGLQNLWKTAFKFFKVFTWYFVTDRLAFSILERRH